ncbi:MAG: hypothetical protein APG12_01070 [Candidatus Methanofastidiosum methylothiophilum]|uniref:Uncharacterized protein n=1 Tax=Candidatus Methanofastidiosum methylothiophilum TaxID=1705564 RepID=A0A150IL17_9EURY|nr:MAG: hypothetical protein APG10_00613 [Candidatus Methanofastidiosum methylthiophilus]KYC47899.1 MAG: hypothetical protein APG11_00777 [Candidatus Methanofastidiosum methylthiophilus]KYC50076.1 MAG: hypothetical protein APG12_01070 [Candidatus Methanofastidiosum methylthiophilus]
MIYTIDLIAVGALGLIGIIGFVALVFIDAIFLWIGTKFAGIEKASFGKAIIGVLVLIVLSAILGSVLGPLGFLGIILSFIITLWAVKTLYGTSWGKAFLSLILAFIVLAVVLLALLGVGLSSLGVF